MAEEQLVTVTAYEMELVNMITVPAHYSLSEIREAVWAKMSEHAGSEAPNRDHASIIIAPSKFLRDRLLNPN